MTDRGKTIEAGRDQQQEELARLYEADETAWLEESCRLIRAGRLDALDYDNLASFLEDMAIRERREVKSRLRVLLAHLLKWQYQPRKRTKSWSTTIINQRFELNNELTASLRKYAEEVLPESYQSAVKLAAHQTDLPRTAFPADCPYSLDEILSGEELP